MVRGWAPTSARPSFCWWRSTGAVVSCTGCPLGPGTGPDWIKRKIRSLLARFDAPPTALGVALPCLVDTGGIVTGCDTFPRLEGWRADVAFADLGCPVRALDDADAALVEEAPDVAPDATVALVAAGTWSGRPCGPTARRCGALAAGLASSVSRLSRSRAAA